MFIKPKSKALKILALILSVSMIIGTMAVSLTGISALVSTEITDVDIQGKTLDYTGVEQELVSVSEVEGDVVEYYLGEETIPTTSVPKAIDAGTYKVKVSVKREGYTSLEKTVETVINPAEIDIDITAKTGLKYNETKQELVTLEGSFDLGDTVIWTVNGEETNSTDIPKEEAIGSYTVKLTVVRNANYKNFEKEVTVDIDTGVLNLGSLEIKANDRTYDGSAKDALLVENQGDYKLEYKFEDENWQDDIPKITDADTYKVYVRAVKTGYHNAEYPVYPISITIAKAKITGVTATGYSAKYDKQAHKAIEYAGTLDDDKITYSKNADGSNDTNTVYNVKDVKDSGTYYLVVDRGENYEVLIVPVTVSITKNDQQTLSFTNNADVTYNADNTIKCEAVSSADDANGEIVYEKVGGTADFEVTADGVVTYKSVGTIKVKATISNCANYNDATQTFEFIVDYVAAPQWTMTDHVYENNGCKWYKDTVEIIPEAKWTVAKGGNAVDQAGWSDKAIETAENDYNDYKVAFKDEKGNITDLVEIPHFAIDTTKPSNLNVQFEKKNTSLVAKVINFLTFGLFCNDEMVVTVNCDDQAATTGAPNSGVKTIQLFKYDKSGNGEEVDLADREVNNVFILPIGFEGTVKVKVTDNAGNVLEEQLVSEKNSNMKNVDGYIMIEETAPVLDDITVAGVDPTVRKQDGEHNYSGDVNVSFKAQDQGAGLYSVTATLNDVDYTLDSAEFSVQDTTAHTYIVSTKDKEANANGEYNFVFTVTDNAGNVTTDGITVKKDLSSPIVKGFKFVSEDKNVDLKDVVSIEDYGYYFKEKTTVTVTANDEKASRKNEFITGVDKITVVLVDKDGKYYTVDENNKIVAIDDLSAAYAHIVTDNKYVFDMVDDFKGQIYAFATDKVGNQPTNSVFVPAVKDADEKTINIVEDGELKGYAFPAGSVLESKEKHDNADYDHVAFEKAEAPFKTSDNKELYAGDVDVKLTVTDNYSGIETIEWSVTAPYDTKNNQSGQLTIKNNEAVQVDEVIGESGWKVLAKDKNLVTKVEKNITVKNDSNNIVVTVKMVDRAGNETVDVIEFNIDKQVPIITVEMNDNDDEKYNGFFKEDRAYKVTVLERNFIKAVNFVATVTDQNNKKSNVTITPNFKLVMEDNKPKATVIDGIEYYVYEWNSKFAADGDYTFGLSAIDLANNETKDTGVSYVNAEDKEIRTICNKFTIDQTLPAVSVSYDNNTATNGKYFAKERTATVVIKEHNFDVDRVDFSAMTASINNKAISKPKVKWAHKGDVHTAKIAFKADGDYTFDVVVTDKANNQSKPAKYGKSVAAKDFVVDKTIVKPTISGIKDGGAYKNKVVPSISFEDVNFDSYEIELLRTRKDEKLVDVTSEYLKNISEKSQNISGTFDTFDKIVENDGIYTLMLKVTDKAGNEESEEYTFTVNRFGSVYEYNEELAELIKDGGQYVKSVDKDIVITEYNAEKLLAGSLKILVTRDGEAVDVDYTCSPKVNNSVSIGESGWYQYVYTVKAANFEQDGVYKISLASEYSTDDSAKNESTSVPENSIAQNGDKIADTMTFTVDSVAPEIRNIINLDKKIAEVEKIVNGKLNVKYTIVDVGGLKSVQILLNGKEIETVSQKELEESAFNYTGDFDIAEQDGTSAQKIQILVTDLAGNVTDTSSQEFLKAHSSDNKNSTYVFYNEVTVSRNALVRFYANKWLFWGSVFGVIVIVGGIWFIISSKKKKDE